MDREYLAFTDRLPRLERNAIDDARKIGAHRDAAHRCDGADGGQCRRPLLLARDNRGDGFRRRLERRALSDRRLDLSELHEPEAGDDRQRHGQHQKHAFQHVSATSSGLSVLRYCRSRSVM